jgi:6-pyruvoyltetrahydropterin/6-carboxytetrahydropterin synthase
MEICKSFTFEASHILPKHPGKCSRLHGHSWKLTVYVKGPVNKETGFVIDYGELKRIVQPVVDNLDHKHLGSWYHPMFDNSFVKQDHFVTGLPFDFYPSSENLIVWIGKEIDLDVYGACVHNIPMKPGFEWSRLELDETCTSKCILTREEYEQTRECV